MGRVASHEKHGTKLRGKEANAVTAKVEYGGGQLDMTFSNGVAGLGLVSVRLGKMTLMEAIEWGRDEVEETPTKPDSATPARPASG